MGKQGKATPDPIRLFIILEKRNAPGLKQRQLAARVEAKFGIEIDKSTVGRILSQEGDLSSLDRIDDGRAITSENDQGLESHQRELNYFGQRIRDRLALLAPHQALTQWKGASERAEPEFWCGRPAIPERDPVELSEEELIVEEGWKSGSFNARTHPLFPSFREHLAESRLWRDLNQLDDQVGDYLQACELAHAVFVEKVKTRLPSLTDVDIQSVALSLIAGASRSPSADGSSLEFSYAVDQEMSGDEVWWSLRLGAWSIRSQHRDDLQILMGVHKTLLEESLHWDEVLDIRRHQAACQATILAFQEALTPHAKLRRLVSAGHCDLCPPS